MVRQLTSAQAEAKASLISKLEEAEPSLREQRERFTRTFGGGFAEPQVSRLVAQEAARKAAEEAARKAAEDAARKKAEDEARRQKILEDAQARIKAQQERNIRMQKEKAEAEAKARGETLPSDFETQSERDIRKQQEFFGLLPEGSVTKEVEVKPEPTETRIEEFDTTQAQLPFPTRESLGADPSFGSQARENIGSVVRNFLNEQTAEDLSRQVRGEEGVSISPFLEQQQLIRFPSGTITDQPPQTIAEFAQIESIVAGGAAVPIQFISQNLAKQVALKTQKELDTLSSNLQGRVSSGKITVEQANEILRLKQQELQAKAQKIFEKKQKDLLLRRGRAEAGMQSIQELRRVDLARGLTTGALITGAIVAPVPTGVALATMGATTAIRSGGKGVLGGEVIRAEVSRRLGEGASPEEIEKGVLKQRAIELGKAGLGLSFVALGTRASFGALERSAIQLEISEKLAGLEKEQLKFSEIRIEGDKEALSFIKGFKEFGGLRQEVDLVGKVIKQKGGKFIIPRGVGESRVSGVVSDVIPINVPEKLVFGIQEFEFGAKGIAFRLSGVEKSFGAIAKTTTVPTVRTGAIGDIVELRPFLRFPSPTVRFTDLTGKSLSTLQKQSAKGLSEQLTKNLKLGGTIRQDFVGSISKQVEKDLFLSRTGKIEGFEFSITPRTQLSSIDIALKDIGITKVFSADQVKGLTTLEILKGTGTGLPRATISKTILTPSLELSAIATQVSKSVSTIIPPIVTQTPTILIGASLLARTEVLEPKVFKVTIKEKFVIPTTEAAKFKDQTRQIFSDLGIQETRFRTGLITKTQQKQLTKQRQQEKTLISPLQSISTKALTRTLLGQPQKQRLRTKQLTKQIQRLSSIGISPTVKLKLDLGLDIKPPIIFGFPFLKAKKGKKKKDEFGLFKVFGKRFGEDILIGRTKTQRGAEQQLEKFLRQTLGRSGFIQKGKKRLTPTLLRDPVFRGAKREPLRVVQRRRFSLGTVPEVQEIQFFKRKKSKSMGGIPI